MNKTNTLISELKTTKALSACFYTTLGKEYNLDSMGQRKQIKIKSHFYQSSLIEPIKFYKNICQF